MLFISLCVINLSLLIHALLSVNDLAVNATILPTKVSSNLPSFSPTFGPSNSPTPVHTNAPTRAPTESDWEWDKIEDITYFYLDHLNYENTKQIISDDTFPPNKFEKLKINHNIRNYLQHIISKALFDAPFTYHEFDVNISSVSFDGQSDAVLVLSIYDRIYDIKLLLTTQIKFNSADRGYLESQFDTDKDEYQKFRTEVTNEIQSSFNNRTIFDVTRTSKPFNYNDRPEDDEQYPLLWFLVSWIGLILLTF